MKPIHKKNNLTTKLKHTTMKIHLLYYLTAFILISCYTVNSTGKYSNQFFDEYKQKQTTVLLQQLYPKEYNSSIQSATFEWVIQCDSAIADTKLYINLTRKKASQLIENELYIKINEGSILKVPLRLSGSETHEVELIENNTSTTTDSTGTHESTSTSNTRLNYHTDAYQAQISDEILEKLKNSYALSLRLYSGAIPSTFTLGQGKMQKFNCFVNQQ
jgi:hypothetical protein